jgi:hypothetical protein
MIPLRRGLPVFSGVEGGHKYMVNPDFGFRLLWTANCEPKGLSRRRADFVKPVSKSDIRRFSNLCATESSDEKFRFWICSKPCCTPYTNAEKASKRSAAASARQPPMASSLVRAVRLLTHCSSRLSESASEALGSTSPEHKLCNAHPGGFP